MHQDWGKLLFMHWRVDPTLIRHLVPDALELDLYGDSAWIGIVPFTMWDIRAFPPFAPTVPGLDEMHELNVRTYVHLNGVPGVWFFSLDATKVIPVLAARFFFALNYLKARIDLCQAGRIINYALNRPPQEMNPGAELEVSWTIGDRLPSAEPGSREFFLRVVSHCHFVVSRVRRTVSARAHFKFLQLRVG